MEVGCRLPVVPPNQSTASHTLWTQRASATAFLSLGGTYHGLRYRLARVNGIGIHWDPGNRRPFDYNGDLPPLQKEYWLPRASTNVFQTRDLQTQCTRQYHYWLRQGVYQSILGQSLLPPQHQSLTLDRFPPADRQSNWAAESVNGAVPSSLLQLRAGQLGWIVTAGGIFI